MLSKKVKNSNGITLVALVITIIILLILATISIQSLTNTGLFKRAQEAREKMEQAEAEQAEMLNEYENALNGYYTAKTEWTGKVNKPKLMTGMTPIKFTEPTGDGKANEGSTVKTTDGDTAWYDYDAKKWANAQTQDGSMWVWIPRFAYKVNSSKQTFDVVFLKDTTNIYVDNGTEKNAETEGYIVHPAFKDESSIDYANGGWDKELTGIWVAKFKAGFASGNNSATPTASSVKYTQADAWVGGAELGGSNNHGTARN